jgi:hypothetical protein
MGLQGERTVALNGNHLEIVKYDSKIDDNFKTVAGRLAIIVKDIHAEQSNEIVNT